MVSKVHESKGRQEQVVEKVADLAMQLGGRHLAIYGNPQPPRSRSANSSCLILRAYLKTCNWGVTGTAGGEFELAPVRGLSRNCPITRPCKSLVRVKVLEIADAMIQSIARSVGPWNPEPAAMVRPGWGCWPAPIFNADAVGSKWVRFRPWCCCSWRLCRVWRCWIGGQTTNKLPA